MEILANVRNFMTSRVILTAAEFDFFTILATTPMTAGELAGKLGLDLRATTRLLDCVITLGLLSKTDGRYQVTADGFLLSAHHAQTILPMLLHLNGIWHNWSILSDAVRQGKNPHQQPIVMTNDDKQREAFIGAMHVAGRQMAREIAAAYDLSPFRKLLDIGGASGTYTIAFLAKNPEMRAVLFDLPGVVTMARERIAAEKLEQRVEIVAGDFYENELPGGCDLALLSAIIHQNSPEQNVALYRKVYSALLPGGKLLIRDHIMDESRTVPNDGTIFALNMLVNTPAGDIYTLAEVEKTLLESGFSNIRLVRQGNRMDCLIEAKKPDKKKSNGKRKSSTVEHS
jgi:predicted O-methyltransferase YrrM